MSVKMIVMDLDKTLLKSDNTVSEYTKSILNECKKRGIIIAINSARPKRAVVKFEKMIDCDNVICLNGGMITIAGKTIETNKIDKDMAKDVIEKVLKLKPNYKISLEINDYIYSNFNVKDLFEDIDHDIITDFEILEDDPYKMIFWLEKKEDVEEILNILPKEVYGKIALDMFLQVMDNGASKFKGVEALANHYNIALEDTATFGDDHDDIEMIKYCGYGVAMENAVEPVIAASKYVTLDSNSDGVARWLDENVLK